jgi:ubiquinone/menaquinone biosynthesis C-methylase UbiE
MQISRVKRSKISAKAAYDRLSPIYDGLAGSSETQFMLQGLEMLVITPGEAILEIGCGTGKALVSLSRQTGSSGKVTAIDLSSGMLQKTSQRLAKAGLRERVNLLEGDGASLPCRSGSFNAVFICFTLELFDTPEIPLVLAECQRVLTSGGRLGVVSMLKSEHPGWVERLYEWLHDKLPAYVDCRPINTQELIQLAGFTIEKHQSSSMWGLPVDLLMARMP